MKKKYFNTNHNCLHILSAISQFYINFFERLNCRKFLNLVMTQTDCALTKKLFANILQIAKKIIFPFFKLLILFSFFTLGGHTKI